MKWNWEFSLRNINVAVVVVVVVNIMKRIDKTHELLLELGVPVVLDIVVSPAWQLSSYN